MPDFDFSPIERAVAALRTEYPDRTFDVICQYLEGRQGGIATVTVMHPALDTCHYSIIVPQEGIGGERGYREYIRDLFINAGCLPPSWANGNPINE